MGMLGGKAAIVISGGRGVCLGHARMLAGEGASVVVDDLGDDERLGTDAHLATSSFGPDGRSQ